MPLTVSNGLPATEFRLGDIIEAKVPCRFHLDSCAIMNTRTLLVHKWLMTKYPEIVHCYEKFNDSNPIKPIMLEGALNMESAKEFEAVKLTATLTYKTSYNHSNVEPVRITLGLGATVSANAIIGLPALTAW